MDAVKEQPKFVQNEPGASGSFESELYFESECGLFSMQPGSDECNDNF